MSTNTAKALDWATIHGYGDAKRAIEVAASGYLPILLVGPDGSGKATLARSLPTILPDPAVFIEPDPFIAISKAIDQATSNKGILFLEHVERWSDTSLALLRETVVQHPGKFLLVATTGYCACGNYMDERKECTCTCEEVHLYQKRLGQTVHACFAMEQRIQIPWLHPQRRSRDESSRQVRERVLATLAFQRHRLGGRLTSELSLAAMQAGDSLLLEEPAQRLLQQVVAKLPLPGEQERYLHQVARTVAYMSMAHPLWDNPVTHVQATHIAEAICCRPASYWQ